MSLKNPKNKIFYTLRKKWLKSIPTKAKLKKKLQENKRFRFLYHKIHDKQLWSFNHTSVPRAFGIGFFMACIPVPFQMLLALITGVILRANLILSVALVWISNPITMGPIFYFCYKVGQWFLSSSVDDSYTTDRIELNNFISQMHLIWQPFLIGCLICAIISGLTAYLLCKLYFSYYKTTLKKIIHKLTKKD